jgi:hypothetical protein
MLGVVWVDDFVSTRWWNGTRPGVGSPAAARCAGEAAVAVTSPSGRARRDAPMRCQWGLLYFAVFAILLPPPLRYIRSTAGDRRRARPAPRRCGAVRNRTLTVTAVAVSSPLGPAHRTALGPAQPHLLSSSNNKFLT